MQFIEGRRHPCGDAKVILLAQSVQNYMKIPQLLLDKVVDVLGVVVVQVPRGAVVEEIVEISQLPLVEKIVVSIDKVWTSLWSSLWRIWR